VHDHMFPAANTAIPLLVDMPDAAAVVAKHEKFLEGALRVDLFGLRRGGSIDGQLIAPLRPEVPALVPGESYLIETVMRTLRLGHPFTEGTADSNEVWVELVARAGDRVIGKSGERDATGAVDPWSHFVNSFVLDREGNRIDRRNPESIFVPLYNHQIPPGAADVVHYLLRVPKDAPGPITIEARLLYRKFDTTYLRYVYGPDYVNRLPITTIARDRVVLPVAGRASRVENEPSPIEPWQRFNDYGIALLLKPGRGELRQAEEAFHEVERLGRADGPVNLARVYLRDGRVGHEAPEALRRAASFTPGPYEWTVLWLSGLVNKQNARLDEAIRDFEQILAGGFVQAEGRGFDFSRDYRLLNELALTLFERAKQERGAERRPAREALLGRAVELWERVLTIDSENLTAHYNLGLVYTELGDARRAAEHVALHARYKPDDNARDRAVAAARMRYPAADRAAEAVVIYDLGRSNPQEVASVAP
jgi:hypothetical protein